MEQFNLTFPQKNIYMVDVLNSNTALNTIAGVLKINKNFNSSICINIIRELIRANDAMRTRLTDEEEPKQYFKEYTIPKIDEINMNGKSEKEVETLLKNLTSEPIDIHSKSLVNFSIIATSKSTGMIYLKLHHIVGDAWTLMLIINQLADMYNKKLNNEDITIKVPSYKEYILAEQEYLNSEKYLKDEEFWKEYIEGISEPVSLKEKVSKVTTKADRYSVRLSKDENDKLINFAKENRVSPYTIFLAALANYVYRIKDVSEVVIGTPILNRANFKEKQMLGCFISTIPMRIKITENMKFMDLVKEIGSQTMSLFRHQKYPITKTIEHVHNTSEVKGKIYNMMLSYQNARSNVKQEDGMSTEWIFSGDIQDDLEIHVLDMDSTGILTINYDYLTDLFEKVEIEYLHTRLMALIMDAIKNIDVSVEDIRIMSKEEENKILYEFNDTDMEYPKDKTVIELFEEQVEKTPDNIALVFEDKQMTYKELNEKANSLAHYLKEEKGVKPNDVVALLQKRGFNMIISILAVLKSGAAYLPIDVEFPQDRIQYMLKNSEAQLLITGLKKKINFDNIVNIKEFDYSRFNVENLSNNISIKDMIYIIYTSGTTGKPKGVMINHGNVTNLIFAAKEYQNLNECQVWGAFSTYSFDISILEIFVPLSIGGKIILANEEQQKLPQLMCKLIQKNKIEVINMTPTRMRLLIDFTSEKQDSCLKICKRIMLGGEVFSKKLYIKMKAVTNAKIYDGYGPTEITVWSSAKLLENEEKINIGKSLPNMQSYILDKKHRILPIGICGELCIGGNGVAKGYYNNDESTNQKFITFIDNKKIYTTGDFSFYDFNGELNFVGRIDSQIKLNGLRIEIEEIEAILRSYIDITNACVIVKDKKLIAYYTSNSEIDEESLKDYLKMKLPNYMIPGIYQKVEKFNLTTLGKIDKNNLPSIIKKEKKEVLPRDDNEKVVYDEICKILGIQKFSIYDNIFDIGMDSIDTIKLLTNLAAKDIRISYNDIFKLETVQKIAQNINTAYDNDISEDLSNYDYTNINELLSQNYLDNKIMINNFKNKDILLIGVTGFLGIHILDYLIKNTNKMIYCLMRKKKFENLQSRFIKYLRYYFDEKYVNKIKERVFLIDGDITCENLISDKLQLEQIKKNIGIVINSAAYVKHYGQSEKFIEINYEGAKKVADFCNINNLSLVHISTLSVSGNILESGYRHQKYLGKDIFTENDLYYGQELNNIYVYTKFLAERYILDLIYKGLDAKIIRVGNLTGRYSDGKFQYNSDENAFVNRIKSILNIHVFPKTMQDFEVEFTPVDLAAMAVIKSIECEKIISHIYNIKHINMKCLQEMFNKLNLEFKFVSQEQFNKVVNKYIKNDPEKIQGIIIDLDKNNMLNYNSKIKINGNFTVQELKKNGFEWPSIDEIYLKKFFKELNLL